MRFVRPKGVLSGFLFDGPHPELPELRQFGEYWAPHGWHVGLHAHEGWEVYFQAKGTSSWQCQGKQFELLEGQGYIVAPGAKHQSIRFSKGSQHFYFAEWNLPRHATRQSVIPTIRGFQAIPNAPGLEPLFRMLIAEGTRTPGQRQKPILMNLLSLLTLQMERILDDSDAVGSQARLANAPFGVVQAKELLENNLEHDWKLDELGRIAGISPNYLSTTFANCYGMSPMRYLLSCRIERSKHLLRESELSITAIAHELGFSSIQHFSMRFKEQVHQTPSAYRRRAGRVPAC
ncbi:MAG: helix-turn-helix domain-containing protein [Puniceicoccaceae bacterium]